MPERILLIDDDTRLAEMVSTYLRDRGLLVDHRPDVATGLPAARSGAYDALILDLMLPDGDGLEVCRSLRAEGSLPILMLTARGDELDRIIGLELGADDYLPKPFHPRELLARLKAILRRGVMRPDAPMVFGALRIDRAARVVHRDGVEQRLTSHQFDLLVALAERTGRVLSRDQLMQVVRGTELEPYDRSIDVHVSRIRAAIESDPKNPRLLRTIRGVGYVFTDPGH